MIALTESVSWELPAGTPTAAERSPPVRRAMRDSSHAAMWARWSLRLHSPPEGVPTASASRPAWSRSSSAQPPSILPSSCSFVSLSALMAQTSVTGSLFLRRGLRALYHQVEQTVGHVYNAPGPASAEHPRDWYSSQRAGLRFTPREPCRHL